MSKYITVKLTEDQHWHLKWLLFIEADKSEDKKTLAFNKRLQTKLTKAKSQLNS